MKVSPRSVFNFLFALVLISPVVTLGQVQVYSDTSRYTYKMPEYVSGDWEVAGLDESGINEEVLGELVLEIRQQKLPNLHAVLIIKNEKLVFEEYFEGVDERRGISQGVVRFDQNTLHDLRSVTKSVTSTLVGIAADEGELDVEDSALSYFPSYESFNEGGKDKITVEHLLTMTSGLEWDERTYPYTDPRNSETAMDLSESSTGFVFQQKLMSDPGSQFQYCGGCTMVLAGIVRNATGKNLDALAEAKLFQPLGITRYEWLHHKDGLPIAASGLRLLPRDMAKIGLMYLNKGKWQDKQVLSESWVMNSIEPKVELDSTASYGYQWWVDFEGKGEDRFPVYVARGNGGQRIYIVPHLNLVAVITAGNYNKSSRPSELAFWRFVLPASS